MIIHIIADAKGAVTGFREAAGESSSFGSKMGSAGKIAAVGLGLATAAVGAVTGAIVTGVNAYEAYGKQLLDMTRLTGLTAQQASLLAGQWKLTGVDASSGETALRRLAKTMDTAQQGGKAAEKTFSRLGISLKDSGGHMLGVNDVLDQVRLKMSELKSPTERTALAMTLFGRGGATMVPWLTQSPKAIGEMNAKIRDMGLVVNGSGVESFKKLHEQQLLVSEEFNAVKIRIGAAVMPIIADVMPKLQQAFSAVVSVVKDHWPEISAAAHVVFDDISKVATPIVAIFVEEWPKISAAAKFVFDEVKSVVTTDGAVVGSVVSDLAKTIGVVVENIKAHWSQIAPLFNALKTYVVDVFTVIVEVTKTALKLVGDVIHLALALIRGDWKGAWDDVKKIVGDVWNLIKVIVQGAAKIVVDMLRVYWNELAAIARVAWTAMWSAMKGVWADIRNWASTLGRSITSAIGNLGTMLWDAGRAVITGLWSGMKSVWHDVTGWLGGLGGIIKSLKGPLDYDATLLTPAGKAIIGGLHAGLKAAWPDVTKTLAGFTTQIGVAGATPGGASTAGRAFPTTASQTITVNVVLPGGTALIGTAQQVGQILAPHIATALSRTAANQGRSR
jgi:hypothetical protein